MNRTDSEVVLAEADVRPATPPTPVKFLKLKDVLALCAISRTSLYDAMKKGNFPLPVKVLGRSSRWIESEVLECLDSCIKARHNE
jgi:prophage regulatory protein